MRKPKQHTGLWAYMEQQGKLDASGDELLCIKKQWRKQYEKEYKQQKRLKNKEYIITFDKAEAGKIRKAAADHGMKEALFLRKAIGAYLHTVYVIRDKAVLDRILQILLRYQSVIEQVESRDKGAWYKADRNYENLNSAINTIRSQIVAEFAHPPLLTDEIGKAVKDNPDFIRTVKSILTEYVSEVS